jgi:hypothetical protein
MPDADDFDVEYFRNLLKGNGPKEGHAAAAEPPLPVANKGSRRTAKPTATRAQSKRISRRRGERGAV